MLALGRAAARPVEAGLGPARVGWPPPPARAEGSKEEGVSGVHAGVAGSVAAALAAAGSAGFQGRRSLRAPVGTAAAPLRHTFVAPPPRLALS